MKKIFGIILMLSMLVVATSACKDTKKTDEAVPSPTPTAEANNEAEDLYANKIDFTIETKSGDVMRGELYPDVAPETVANFVKLAKENFYEGLIFHRVIPGFMIQGGGMDENFAPKETKSIKGEFAANGVPNSLKHTRGVISMARTNEPNSASSQFFIMHQDTPALDGQYAAFGKITAGLEVIDKIAEVQTTTVPTLGMQDVPVEPIVIKAITIEENK